MLKTVLVTGANRGIGLELVKQYAQSGCTVLACCRDPHHALELQRLSEAYSSIFIYLLDVSNEDHIKQLATQLKNKTIDILFNNAGIAGEDHPVGSITYTDLISTLKINTIGPILLAQALEEQIVRSENKIIVNMSSVLASIELNQDDSWCWLPYRISKSALNSATRSLANQLKSKGVIVIALNPGWVKTDMGGENADITAEESVSGMMSILETMSLEDSGKFHSYDGRQLPW